MHEQTLMWPGVDEAPPAEPRHQIIATKKASSESTHEQTKLWDWAGDRMLTSYPMMRPFIGDFFEEATIALLDAVRLKTDATADVCPDLHVPDVDVFLETKSVGGSKASLLYEHRIEKYDRFMKDGRWLYYVFWRHTYKWPGPVSLSELRAGIAKSVEYAAIVPGRIVHRAAMESPVRHTSYSGTKGDPGKYYKMAARNIPSSHLRGWSSGQSYLGGVGKVYGFEVGQVPVFGRRLVA